MFFWFEYVRVYSLVNLNHGKVTSQNVTPRLAVNVYCLEPTMDLINR